MNKRLFKLSDRFRFAKQVSLKIPASFIDQQTSLFFRLDPLGNNVQIQTLRHRNDGSYNRAVTRIFHNVMDKRLIDLDLIEGKFF